MSVKVSSIGLMGLEGYKLQVEVQTSSGPPTMVIIGLPDASIKESKERVLSALQLLDYSISTQRIIVNLIPSEQRKNGPLFDLAIAIGILTKLRFIKNEIQESVAFLGALSLDGSVLNAEGLLPAVIAAKKLGIQRLFLPYDPTIPFHMIKGIELIFIEQLNEVVNHLNGESIETSKKLNHQEQKIVSAPILKDFYHVIGQAQAKRALEIAAAGEHNVLMSGPPGCGKSLLAESFPSILPSLPNSSLLEVISLYQLAGLPYLNHPYPPFRTPHHSSSSIALIGGGSFPKPGEISLAHNGVLFLDEMAEFPKKTLEMLRQPLETGNVTISRVHSKVTYPASFILLGATNLCPCGYYGSSNHYCTCTPKQIQHYHNRISGPVYDRIDISLSMKSVNLNKQNEPRDTSEEIRNRVTRAREKQYSRYNKKISNAKVPFEQLMAKTPLTKRQNEVLTQVSVEQDWSNRAQMKIIRLARTISDLDGYDLIPDLALKEAVTLRHFNARKHLLLQKKGAEFY